MLPHHRLYGRLRPVSLLMPTILKRQTRILGLNTFVNWFIEGPLIGSVISEFALKAVIFLPGDLRKKCKCSILIWIGTRFRSTSLP